MGHQTPKIFRLGTDESRTKFEQFKTSHPEVEIVDTLRQQLIDLIATQHPDQNLSQNELTDKLKLHLGNTGLEHYGAWVYYPWLRKLVHLLDENEFSALRTDRNKNKITAQEQEVLSGKKIGLIGLSVGHAVATTLALERCFGELRIADHDLLDLSNLNRIRTSVQNIGLAKTTIVSREIAELDPYLHVRCYNEGITDDNLREFLTADGGLDVLIDECDSLDIKIRCREMARELGIPVIMETSDRGMLDVERYDLEPNRPLLHGLTRGVGSKQLRNMNQKEAFDLIMGIIDVNNCSPRLQSSLLEINKTLSTWPQLGSDVMHGGASATTIARKILLGQPVTSGRFYAHNQSKLEESRQPDIYE